MVKAPPADLLALADLPDAAGAVIFNTAAPDDSLRGDDCRANVLHTTPSLSMRADALSQFALKKQWTDLAMVHGPNPEDAAFADAIRASLTKFGIGLKGEADWKFDADMRRVADVLRRAVVGELVETADRRLGRGAAVHPGPART